MFVRIVPILFLLRRPQVLGSIEATTIVTRGGIAIWLYPVLRRHNEALALGSVGFRIIEAALFTVAVGVQLSLLPLSQAYVEAGAPDAACFQTVGAQLLALRRSLFFGAGAIAFCLGALMYYCVFYQSRLIPRWLSGWGLVAVALHMSAALLVVFGAEPFSTTTVLLNIPIFLNEMVLAVWLIFKGFNPSAIASGTVAH